MGDDLAARARRPEKSVSLCLRGDLPARRAALVRDLAAHVPDSLADTTRADLQAQLAQIGEQIADATREFTFRALGRNEFRALRDAHNVTPGQQAAQTFLDELVAASLTSPELTGGQVAELLAELSDGQASILETAAWSVNQDSDGSFGLGG